MVTKTQPPEFSDVKVLANDLREQAEAIADEMRFVSADAKSMLSEYVEASEHLDNVKRDCAFLTSCTSEPRLMADAGSARLCVDLYQELFRLAMYFLAVISATTREIETRINKNGVNRSFGLLKFGHMIGNSAMQAEGLHILHKVAITIAFKHGWHHPEEVEGWKSVANKSLATKLADLQHLSAREVLEGMIDNRFAVIWKVLKDAIVDELRRLGRQPKVVGIASDNGSDPFDNIPSAAISAEDEQQRRLVIKLFKREAASCQHAGIAEILGAIAGMLGDPHSLSGMHPREIRASIVKMVCANRPVSEQQARADLRELKVEAAGQGSLKTLKDALHIRLSTITAGVSLSSDNVGEGK